MSIVIARKFGERIVIASDTMISDTDVTQTNKLPGRIKSVVIDLRISICYAGPANQSIDEIRKCKQKWDKNKSITELYEALKISSHVHKSDYIIISHIDGVQIRKITNGTISNDVENAYIGDSHIVKMIFDVEKNMYKDQNYDFSGFVTSDEECFRNSFLELFRKNGTLINRAVGGIAIFLLGSPYGHTYDSYATMQAWDIVYFNKPISDQQMADRASGLTQWSVNVQSTTLRGAAVVSAIITTAGIGYIYSPLESDEAIKIILPIADAKNPSTILRLVQNEANARAARLGGISVDPI
ncbi:hypothetical protein [Roseixanthobacter glucoisosaccharinicivorans]|uniref:hypothetical protein n=1 Tax=Roseixanthobacter glucoisosaccharinicivorans TaxID=3119923 RepID=UPI00372B2EB7